MKKVTNISLGVMLCNIIMQPLYASDYTVGQNASTAQADASQASSEMQELSQYLYNLGSYLGLNLSVASSTSVPTTGQSSGLLSQSNETSFEIYVVNTLMGGFPISSISPLNTFVPSSGMPSNLQSYTNLNTFANLTYSTQNYSTTSTSTVSVIANIDQPTYQTDATSQAIQNIITSPDLTFCPNAQSSVNGNTFTTFSNLSTTNQACNMMIPATIIGTGNQLVSPFSPCAVEPYLSQLNSNSLLGPLLYDTSSSSSSSSSTSSSSSGSGCTGTNTVGLPNETQAQVAEAFVRYASGGTTPPPMPQASAFSAALSNAQNNGDPTLSNYLTELREYAAQSSVPISNLYFMMQRRMPQSNNNNLSQALLEFQQASWRLMNPQAQGSSGASSGTTTQQWSAMINDASPATVQKESALLLAEINYQLYLLRQFQERQLLTESIIALLVLNTGQMTPNPNLNTRSSVQSSTPTVTYATTGQ